MSSTEHPAVAAGPSWRALVVSVLLVAAILAIPLFLLRGLVAERMNRASESEAKIIQSWGGPQSLVGPILLIPMLPPSTDTVVALPHSLEANATLITERRSRGLFEALLYRSSARLFSRFEAPNWVAVRIDPHQLDFAHARLRVGLAFKGVHRAAMTFDGRALDPSPVVDPRVAPAGIEADVGGLDLKALARGLPVSIDLDLAGSGGLSIAPVGNTNTIKIAGDWPHPEFAGPALPDARTVRPDGFSAEWTLSKLSRGYPNGSFISKDFALGQNGASVQIIEPVDLYAEIDRLMKYGFVVIAFAFAAIGLGAAVIGAAPHPVQWLMAGAAVALSFLMTLALAEHVGFAAGYAIASAVETAMVALYLGAVVDRRLGFGLGLTLALVDGFLYFVLGSERYALLAGSIGLCLALAAAMILTRRLDWERLAPLRRRAPG